MQARQELFRDEGDARQLPAVSTEEVSGCGHGPTDDPVSTCSISKSTPSIIHSNYCHHHRHFYTHYTRTHLKKPPTVAPHGKTSSLPLLTRSLSHLAPTRRSARLQRSLDVDDRSVDSALEHHSFLRRTKRHRSCSRLSEREIVVARETAIEVYRHAESDQ